MQELISSLLLSGAVDTWGIPLTHRQVQQFAVYADLLVRWNAEKMNLTRITDPAAIASLHFLDSLSILHYCSVPLGARLLDVGTGAGLPGIALKIARPDLKVVLMDGTAKKLAFCSAVIEELELSDIDVLHARAEDAAKDRAYRSAFDIVTARAVASMDKLVAWCAPFAAPGGQILALKGAAAAAELSAARSTLRTLPVQNASLIPVVLPVDGDVPGRSIIRLTVPQNRSGR